MAPSAADEFRANRSTSLTIDGEQIFAVFRTQVRLGERLRITRLEVAPGRNQILNLRIEPGAELVTNGISASALALHSDRAPVEADLLVAAGPGATKESEETPDIPEIEGSEIEGMVNFYEVVLWNGWTTDGIDHGWLGEAGMRLEGTEPLVLACRDGFGETDFSDLVVRIEVLGAGHDDDAEDQILAVDVTNSYESE